MGEKKGKDEENCNDLGRVYIQLTSHVLVAILFYENFNFI